MKATRVAVLVGTAFLLVGTTSFSGDLEVDGLVETATGFKFPDGSIQESAASQYDHVLIVAKAGGHFVSIQDAINSTTPTPVDRYLVYVAPGVYTERVTMKAGVDIQGAGALTTKITLGGSPADDTGTVVGVTDAELRFLTVENTGGASTNAIAIYNNLASPRLTHVQAIALANGGTNAYGVYNRNAAPPMTYVFASATGGSSKNYGVYNITTDLFNPSSPDMRQVVTVVGIAPALGSDDYHGVFNTGGSAPLIRDSQIACIGGTKCYGIYSEVGSPARLENVRIRASDATSLNVGVFSDTNSHTVLRHSHVQGVKGLLGPLSTAYGLQNNMSRPEVHHSILVGDTHPMFGSDPKVAYSQLIGPLAAFTAGSCLGVYDDTLTPRNSQCS